MSTHVLRDAFMQHQTAVRGIILTANAVPLRLLPVVRPIIRSPVIRHADHQEGIPAAIPVTVAVMIPARQGLLKTIQARIQQQPNAGQDVTDVNPVRPVQVHPIPVLMPERPNVTADRAVTDVTIPAAQDKNRFLVLLLIKKSAFPLLNAERDVTNVNIIRIVMSRQNPARMVVHLTTPAADVPAVIQIRHTAIVTLVRADILLPALTDTAVHLIKDVPAARPAALNVINANRLR